MDWDRRELVVVFAILLIALFLRLQDIDRPLYGDEADWYKSALIIVDGNQQWQNTFIPDSPPLGKAIFVSFYSLDVKNVRYVPLLFAMASLVVAYLLAREYFGKPSALFGLAILAVSVYGVLGAQQVDRDGGMLAFTAMLTFYSYLKYAGSRDSGAGAGKRSGGWLLLTSLSFIASVLLRLNMVMLVVPIFALEYVNGKNKTKKTGKAALWALERLVPFAIAFAVALVLWLLLDSALGLPTMARTFDHYFSYATSANQDLTSRLLRTVVSAGRVIARLTAPLALALWFSAWWFWTRRKELGKEERNLLVVLFAWMGLGVLQTLLVTQGNVPAYFASMFPAVALVVGHFCAKARPFGLAQLAAAAGAVLAYCALLMQLDFNEVNLLLLPAAGLGAFVLAALYWLLDRNLARVTVVLVVMSLFASAFMLTGFRTYDMLRSQAVADASTYLNSVGAQKIAESQERTLDLYASGGVVQYDAGKCVKMDGRPCGPEDSTFPAGFYVVDFPLRPLNLDPAIGARFRFNLFDKSGVEGCELARTYVVNEIVVSEFYKC
ncbi:Dolichyl-phosphate-mannose-protein mannosyltransferase [Candidatus Burarchaeum australiense]|nr:Dolichyl-phosphate-mannose-protein mannosyltransferase [Candidatus Burarchaeum australiense]